MKYIVFIALICIGCRPKTKDVKNDDTKMPPKTETYNLILRTATAPEKDPDTGEIYDTEIPGAINSVAVSKLTPPLKALAAFYSAMGGSYCDGDFCDLTTALGLGTQGSKKHKDLIAKYFPDDKAAQAVLLQDCYLRPSGASSFSDYEFLTIVQKADTITVDYRLMVFSRGNVNWTKGPDVYLFKDQKFKKIKRNLWTFTDQ